LSVASGTQRAYSTSFPQAESPIFERNNWINGGTIGLDWGNVQASSGVAFGTASDSIGLGESAAVLTGNWKPDQMAQATVKALEQSSGSGEMELLLRTTIAEHNMTGYKFIFRANNDGSIYVRIIRANGPLGIWTELGNKIGPRMRSGDVIKATAVD